MALPFLVYVLLGGHSQVEAFDTDFLDLKNAQNGGILNIATIYGRYGWHFADTGDFNNDSIADVVIGNWAQNPGKNASELYNGQVSIVFGNSDLHSLTTLDMDKANVVINGMVGDQLGWELSSAGDVNGDKIDDLIIGAKMADHNGKEDSGRAYLIFGREDWTAIRMIDLTNLNPDIGILFHGTDEHHVGGSSVSHLGDVNEDGYNDFIIGSPGNTLKANGSEPGPGSATVIFGGSWLSDVEEPVDLGQLPIGRGLTLEGANDWDMTGFAVSSAGDFNNDGVPDILVTAPFATAGILPYSGKVYVVFGSSALSTMSTMELAAMPAGVGLSIEGFEENDDTGESVSAAGDVNGDGIDDIVIGARGSYRSGFPGRAHIVFGGTYLSGRTFLPLGYLTSSQGLMLMGRNAGDMTGLSVGGAGDVNADGYDDVIIGAPEYVVEGQSGVGAAYIVYGNPELGIEPTLKLGNLNEETGLFIQGCCTGKFQHVGYTVAIGGDVDADGIDDVFVGSFGSVYVIFGKQKTTLAPTGTPTQSPTACPIIENVTLATVEGQFVFDTVPCSGPSADDFLEDLRSALRCSAKTPLSQITLYITCGSVIVDFAIAMDTLLAANYAQSIQNNFAATVPGFQHNPSSVEARVVILDQPEMPAEDTQNTNDQVDVGAIAGLVVGAVVFLGFFVVTTIVICRHCMDRKTERAEPKDTGNIELGKNNLAQALEKYMQTLEMNSNECASTKVMGSTKASAPDIKAMEAMTSSLPKYSAAGMTGSLNEKQSSMGTLNIQGSGLLSHYSTDTPDLRDNFPAKLSEIKSLNSTWRTHVVLGYVSKSLIRPNMAYKLSIAPDALAQGNRPGIGMEIWMRKSFQNPLGKRLDTVTIGKAEYDVWVASEPKQITFVRKIGVKNVTRLELNDFLRFVVNQRLGGITNQCYLHGVEAGYEMYNGDTLVRTTKFQLSVVKA